jgi:MYXO-CTERM domain-containing protein
VGLRVGELTITTDSTEEPTLKIPLRGTAGPPAIQLDSTSVFFPTTNVGATSSPLTITATNVGYSDLQVTAAVSPSPVFVVDATGFAGTVAPAAKRTFTVSFAPSAPGLQTSMVSVTSSDPNQSTVNVTVSGLGRAVDAGAADAVSTDAPADGGSADVANEDAPPAIVDASSDAKPADADAAIADVGEAGASGPDASSSSDASMASDADGSMARADAAAGGSGGSSSGGAGRAGSGTSMDAASDGAGGGPVGMGSDEGGCGCRMGAPPHRRAFAWATLFALGLVRRRRRPWRT